MFGLGYVATVTMSAATAGALLSTRPDFLEAIKLTATGNERAVAS